MKDEITLKGLFEIIKSKILIIISATVLVTTAAAVITKFYISPEYTSSIKLCVVGDFDTEGGSSVSNENSMINYVKNLIETCIETLNAQDAYVQINSNLRELNASYENTNIDSSNIRIEQVGNSNVLRVTATTENAQLSYDTCQAFETMAKERVPIIARYKLKKLIRLCWPRRRLLPIC